VEAFARRARIRLQSPAGATGASPSTTDDPDPAAAAAVAAGLTAREREVLELVAGGLTDRQIAASLFISVNTAGVHVSRILGKLGAANRTEAADIARRRGIVAR
ncbi:MAG: LuxR C-terminal-related transcriptional regulator, partial [Chloroflexi bacterium]|nr:LuxR C-terminal-related transcriptional regulator [Chloroflexota bacterium]